MPTEIKHSLERRISWNETLTNTRILFFTALVLTALCSHGAETNQQHETLTTNALSQWQDSRDGKVSVRLGVDKTIFGIKDKIVVRCVVTNKTDLPITILRPFGDPSYAECDGIAMIGPNGSISYVGPQFEQSPLLPSSFIELQAHTAVKETLELHKDFFPGFGKAGLYTIKFSFSSFGYPTKPAPTNFWLGHVKATSVTILLH